jgi:hypothetical protein
MESGSIQASAQSPISIIGSNSDEVEAPRLLAHQLAEGLVNLADDESLDCTAASSDERGELRLIEAVIHQFPIERMSQICADQGVACEPVVKVSGFDYFEYLLTVRAAAFSDLNVCRRIKRLVPPELLAQVRLSSHISKAGNL